MINRLLKAIAWMLEEICPREVHCYHDGMYHPCHGPGNCQCPDCPD